ncbi:RTA1-domain-containing protein [Gymnopus androsaceus JB14]|uniref:RTA1-domain-containing protein n=1 Tax=Gymnopus androsaceus JB14 TaxID=1447944 RepID=A0A6A4HHC7_9AGAR|nr:RTA1-domain-containing protein [Gymnopus androsaceus JB14]
MLDNYFTSLTSFVARDNTSADDDLNPYGYTPSFAVGILFMTLFGISTFTHFCQAIAYRKWFFLYTAVFAGLIELAGWYGRVWSSKNVDNADAFTIQIVCTIVAPTPLLAANFIILARIIRKLGDSYSRLRPRRYSRIFVTCDIIALFVQAGGGSVASGTNISQSQVNTGSNIMLGGIGFQVGVMLCYMALATEYFWRFSRQRPVRCSTEGENKTGVIDHRLQLLIYALMFNTACLFIRAIYRTIELSYGFNGKVIRTQWLFCFFDATMVAFAMYTLNIAHPGRLLDENDKNSPTQTKGLSSSTELSPTNFVKV